MTGGAPGDLILAGVIQMPNAMIGGILIFAVGHLLYIAAFSQTAQALACPIRGVETVVSRLPFLSLERLLFNSAPAIYLWIQVVENE